MRATLLTQLLNASAIPTLANCFSRCQDFEGNGIVLFDGGFKALRDPYYPSHAFPITREYGNIFTVDEIAGGLTEESLERFCKNDKNKIVSCYYWTGWDDPVVRGKAEALLAGIRSRGGKPASYNYQFILYRAFLDLHLPFIANIWKKSINFQAKACAQESNWLLRTFGCPFAKADDDISPRELEMNQLEPAYANNTIINGTRINKITNFYEN
jgi:hypothetical protein